MGRRKLKKVFWGILFLLGALALLLGQLGYLEGLGFWSVFFSIVLLGILVEGILTVSFGEILFSLAGLIIVNDELLHLEAVTPWTVLGVALLGTIGLNIIFPKRKRWKIHKDSHWNKVWRGGKNRGAMGCHVEEDNGEILSGEDIHYEVSFGDAIKYISGQGISRVFLECSFGNLEVYFNDAVLKDNRADAAVDCSFGNMELYVPAGWKVIINIDNSFGGVEESGYGDPNGENVLFVKGDVSFGHMIIHHV